MRPVARALLAQGIVPSLILTDQHRLAPKEFGLEAYPQINLGCAGQTDPHGHVRSVSESLRPLMADRPGLVVVQGDTSSALGAALAGFVADIPVAHVEAGLRTHDPLLPWPEEEYRTAIDAGAELLFAPTETAAANLMAENVPGEIHVTGNTSIDAVLELERCLPTPTLHDSHPPRVLVTCHRRESWGEGLQSVAAAVTELAGEGSATFEFVLHPNAFVRQQMEQLLSNRPNISLVEPCNHQGLIERIRASDLVLSDSGGIQEEAPALGVPLLVLREKTERPEGITSGSSILVGTAASRIVAEAKHILADPAARATMSRRTLPFGDGRAGERIAKTIVDWLERTSLTRRRA